MKTKNTDNLLPALAFFLVFTTIVISRQILTGNFFVFGVLFSLGSISLSYSLADKAKEFRQFCVNILLLVFLGWIIYKIYHSSLLYENIMFIIVKGMLLMTMALCLNCRSRRSIAQIQVLSLMIFICLPLFVDYTVLTEKLLVIVYIFVWIFMMRIKLSAFYYTSIVELIVPFLYSFFVLGLILGTAFLFYKNLPFFHVEQYSQKLIETVQFDTQNFKGDKGERGSDKEFYKLQKILRDRLMNREISSNADKMQSISFLTTLFKESPYVQEVEKARSGLMDILKRPGYGFESGDDEQTGFFINEYIRKKVNRKSKSVGVELSNKIAKAKTGLKTKISGLLDMNRVQASKTLEKINLYSESLKDTISNSNLNESSKNNLAQAIADYQSWKIYSIYNHTRNVLEDKISLMPAYISTKSDKSSQSISPVEMASDLLKGVEKAIVREKLDKFTKKIGDLDELLKKAGYKQREEFIKLLETMLESKRKILSIEDLNNSSSNIILDNMLENLYGDDEEGLEENLYGDEEEDEDELEQSLIDKYMINIVSLEIEPHYLTVNLGEDVNLSVKATYSDNSRDDITPFVSWDILDDQSLGTKEGRLITLTQGESAVYATLEGVRSNKVIVFVEEPVITSIALFPKVVNLYLGGIIYVKAIASYGDRSEKNIVDLVSWYLKDTKIVESLGKGGFRAKRLGRTELYVQHRGVRSSPSIITVSLSASDILKNFLLVIFSGIAIFYLASYLIIKANVSKLKKFIVLNPSKFILLAYENAEKVLRVFEIERKGSQSYLKYAKKVGEKIIEAKDPFLELTRRFSETKYSSHVVTSQDASSFHKGYNELMSILKAKYSGNLLNFLTLLTCQHPFTI